jgi:hypothetical protein
MVQQITISRCAGRGERPYLQFTFGVPLRTHPGIVFKLTANPTDTRSHCREIHLYPVQWLMDQASVPLIIRYLKGSISKGLIFFYFIINSFLIIFSKSSHQCLTLYFKNRSPNKIGSTLSNSSSVGYSTILFEFQIYLNQIA